MKTIKQELREAIQAVADNYGVVIKQLSIDWINVTNINNEHFVINKIETSDAQIILPKG